jgi:hypothetical protein
MVVNDALPGDFPASWVLPAAVRKHSWCLRAHLLSFVLRPFPIAIAISSAWEIIGGQDVGS